MKISRRKNLKKGFTLAEMLVVVAIIGILLAVAIPNVISYYRTLKLTELDDSARTIFLAAQNELTALKNKGDAKLQTLATHIDGITTTPALSNGVYSTTPQHVVYVDSSPYTYATDEDIRDTAGTGSYNDNVLVLGSIETEIQGNHYVIEYNPKYGTVYAVWYWEKGSFDYENDAYKSSGIEKPEEKNSRLPKMVGYYGGSAIDRIDVGQMPFPTLDLINAEELRLVIGVPTGTGLSAALTANNVKIDIDINGVPITEVSDFRLEPGNTATIVLDTLNTASYTVGPNTRPTATGDSFTYGMQYKEWLNSCTGLPAPGEDLTITVALSDRNGKLLTQTSTVVVNSLFADVAENAAAPDTYTAQIAYGRHLQNLDEDTSGVTSSITAARQIGNIDFKDGHTAPPLDLESWDATYTDEITRESGYTAKPFNAINNTHLTSFDGNNLTIRNLNVKETGTDVNAGLFGSFGDSTGNYYIDRVTLINAKVSGESNVGALAGEATNTDVTGCKVYIDDNIAYTGTGSAPTAYLTSIGGAVGGLIGSTGGTVKIENSFASTVEHSDSDPVGGLVGRAGGTSVQISGSYAAGYLDGAGTVGGLIGSLTAGTANIDIDNSYAAGIIAGTPTYAGGLIGDIGTSTVGANNAYAAVRYDLTGTPTAVYGAYDGADTTGTNVNCVKQSAVSYETNSGTPLETGGLAGMVGTSFGTTDMWNTGANSLDNTHAYNLIAATESLGTTNPYPYPMLMSAGATPTVVPQYGDWLEDDDEGPMMAYIEEYSDGTYGVYALETDASGVPAVRVNTLQHNMLVVDDFYRVISTSAITGGTFTLDADPTSHTLQSDSTHSTIDSGSKTYNVYTLDDATDWDKITNYYHTIKLSTDETFLYNASFACEAFDVTEWADTGATIDTVTKLTKPSAQGSGTTLQYTDVIIRSARQLANVAAYTTGAGAPVDAGEVVGLSWTYRQLENVDFYAYNDPDLAGKSDTRTLTPAKLTTGKYNGHKHTVSNLYIAPATGAVATTPAGLFESVTNGEIVDLELVNVSVKGGNAVATGGLVGSLSPNGTVNNCGIYVKATTATGKDVTENYGIFTVTGSGMNGVGGLIGHINGGTVIDSFAAVKVVGDAPAATTPTTPVNPVGGFVGQFISGTVENCYAGGFVDAGTLTYEGTSVNVTGKNNVGGFVGSIINNVTFKGVNYSTASVGGGTSNGLFAGASGYELPTTGDIPILYAVAKAFKDDGTGNMTVTAPREESAYLNDPDAATEKVDTTESYNQENDFPYGSNLDTHHGDWILVEVCGLYYDTVGTSTGYYSDGNAVSGHLLFTGRPGDRNVATDDGYIFLSKDDLGDVHIMVAGTSYKLEKKELTGAGKITIGSDTYDYQYTVPTDALNAVTDNYYTAVSINGRVFSANFGLACEIYKGRADNMNTPQKKSGLECDSTGTQTLDNFNGAVVRTARQLANLGIRSNAGEYDSTNRKVYTKAATALQQAKYVQLLDIDCNGYTGTYTGPAGTPVSKVPAPQVLTGSNTKANHTPITLSTGGYDGNGYEIRNLVPGMIRQATVVDGGTVKEALVESGLFGRVTGGKLENITLINATVENMASSVTGGGTVVVDPSGNQAHSLDGTGWNSSSGYFTIRDATISNANVTDFVGDSTGYTATRCASFPGGAGTSKNHVAFTTTTKYATVNIWWGCAADNRYVGIMDSSGKWVYETGDKDEKDPPVKENDKYFNSYMLTEAGTYYVGSTNSRNYIYKVEVIEHSIVTTPTFGITAGYDDGFPEGVKTDDYQVRFGALLGAADPGAGSAVSVTNCGVYVEPADTTSTANYTTAYNDYAVANTDSSAPDAVGGLIGMAGDNTEIDTCFAAVKVEGNNIVGGLIGLLKNGEIHDSYSGGHTIKGMYSTTDYNVTARDKNKGYAGGFAGQIENSGAKDNLKFNGVNYSTSSAKGGAKAGNFAGNIVDADKNWDGFKGVGNTVYGVGATFAPKYTDERAYLDSTMTLHAYDYGNNNAAEPYDMDVLKSYYYPYEVPKGTTWVHHGDWPRRYNIIYYELYKYSLGDYTDDYGNTLKNRDVKLDHGDDATKMGAEYIGFYGKIPRTGGSGSTAYDIINTLRVSGTVYDSGYMIVSDADVDSMLLAINSHYVDNDDKNQAKLDYGDEDYYDKHPEVPRPLHTTTLRTAVKLDFTELTGYKIENKDNTDKTAAGKLLGGNYGYVIPAEGLLLPAASDEFYMETQINGQTYLFNPQFPCEAVNVGIDKTLSDGTRVINYSEIRTKEGINYVYVNESDGKSKLHLDEPIDKLIIRSPLNLAGFVRYSRQSSTGLVKDKIIEYKVVQHMDVDYDFYVNKVYDGYSNNRTQVKKENDPSLDENDRDELNNKVYKEYKTGQKDNGQVPAILDGGQYDGLNHKISNLWLACDSDDSTKIGLFGELKGGAVVQNVRMENIHLQSNRSLADGDKSYKSSAGALAAMVHNATITNVTINDVTIELDNTNAFNSTANNDKRPKYEAIGGAIGKIGDIKTKNSEEAAKASDATDDEKALLNLPTKVAVTDVTVIDPKITVTISEYKTKNVKVGGVIGSADGTYSTYSADATERTRPVKIENSGVYLSEAKKGDFNNMGVHVTGDVTGDYAGGFAGYLGMGVNVTRDYSAIRVRGNESAGGFAGQIEGSHVESCYSGGYLNPATHQYSTTDYNVTAEKTAGGFAGKIQVKFASGSSTSMAMYMTGCNYSTSSVQATGSGSTAGRFAGDADDVAAAALAKKMGGLNNYACGTVAVGSGGTVNTESTVKTGSAIPRQVHSAADFETAPYDTNLDGQDFPFATGKVQKAHHGDWLETELMAAGYWEVEDGKLRLWYIPADDPDHHPVEVLETGAEGFDHDSRDAKRITDAGYFVVSSDTTATLPTVNGLTSVTTDIEERVKDLLGGTAVKADVYGTSNGYSEVQEWTITGGAGSSATFYVNPAYAKAVGTTSGTLGTVDNPYEIRTVKQLDNISRSGSSNEGYFEQTHDIVFETGESYTPNENFAGHFNGGFYRIIDTVNPVFNGLRDGASIENVIVYAPQENKTINGGGLAASSGGTGVSISNTIVAGFTITGTNVGGLVGEVTGGDLTISQSEATNKLTGTGTGSVGGLVGSVSSGTLTVEKSYAGGSITGGTSVGGLVGGSGTGANVTYKDVYSYVDMRNATSATTVYGIGPGSVDTASVLHKYWSTGLGGKTARDSAPVEGVTLAEIKKECQDQFETMSAEEYLKPDADRTQGLENLAEGVTDEAAKFALFPFAAFVTDGADNYHYGDWPNTMYSGLYYWEKEVVKTAANTTGTEEYHFYAYGGEIYEGQVYGQELLDDLCYDHHLNGERANIVDYGYGWFYPDVTGLNCEVKVDGAPNSTEITANNDPIKSGLVKALNLPEGSSVFQMEDTGTYTSDKWTITFTGDVSGSLTGEVNTAFGAAIADQMGQKTNKEVMGGDSDTSIPMAIRTMQQLKNVLNAPAASRNIEHFALTHDIDAAGESYTPGKLEAKRFDGKGYRIIDLKIDAPSGNAALFTQITGWIRNVILYSPKGDATITARSGSAAGIVAELGDAEVSSCVVSGYTITGTGYVGGIAANMNNNKAKIENCQAYVTLEGGSGSNSGVGGIAGSGRGSIENCYAGGKIQNVGSGTPVGGIYGKMYGNSNPTVKNCYSYMDLTVPTNLGTKYAIGETNSGIEASSCYFFDEYANGANTTDQGTSLSYDDMCGKGGESADYVYVSEDGASGTEGLENWGEKMYPFPAVVKVHLTAGVDAGVTETGDYPVHYGDWPYNARAAGIAYWEKYDEGAGNYTYGVQIVGVKANGSKLYKSGTTTDEIIDTLCHERHVDSTGKITEHKIVASGLASFSTYSKLTVDATFSGASSTEQAGVKAAINKAVGGRCVTCTVTDTATSGGTTTFTKAKVKLDTTDINIPLYYNGLFAEVGYEDFGTEANPISIRTVRQLDNIPDTNTATKNFEQNHDLYGEGYPNSYTGATGFKGTYDGQSFKILELSIGPNRSGSDSDAKNSAGLFTSAGGSNCEIKNVIMYSPHGSATISGGSGQGTSNTTYHGVGGIIGRLSDGNAGTKITNCVVAGYTISGADHVGGIVGYAYQGGTITNCASVNTIKGEVDSVNAKGVGGIAGGGDNYGTSYALNINNCYAGGTISDCGNSTVVGGVYGHNSNTGSNLTVKNCYVYVNMSGCGTAIVYTISGDTKGNISENNYYLAGTTSLYPSSCTYQGASKTASDLAATNASTLFPTDSDAFDTADYTYVPGSSGGLTPATPGYEFPAVVTMGDGADKKYVHFGVLPN